MNIGKDKMFTTEDMFKINSYGYRTNISALNKSARKLDTHQEKRDNHKPCMIVTEMSHIIYATI